MAIGITPTPFSTGQRLIDGSTLNTNFAHPTLSSQTGITATASGTQATAYALTTRVNNVTTVANANDSISLLSKPLGKVVWVMNNGANSMQVYGAGTNTINNIATATGIAHPAGALVAYIGITATNWEAQLADSATFGALVATTFNGNTINTGSDTVTTNAAVQTLTNKTLTNPVIAGPIPVAVGSSATAAAGSGTYLLNTVGGSTLTLPAATGTGNTYRVIVTATTTSAAHKILAASSSDFINGLAFGENAGTAKAFASAAATNHSIQMPFAGSQPSGGFIGDWFQITDMATNLWNVNGMYQAGTTPTTPFSTATS